MADTPQIEYEHSAAATHVNFFTNDLRTTIDFGGKDVMMKDGGVLKVFDPNRHLILFEFSCELNSTAYDLLFAPDTPGYLIPASAPDYTTAYPRFVKVYYDSSNYWENVEVVCVKASAASLGLSGKWMCTFAFKTKND